ncbi:apolipoprotein N-acyltransferase [Pelagibacteraceae bacterium]|nr:apolipoprotein N-acyltransferase [Pelagibacteraceae bacterium]
MNSKVFFKKEKLLIYSFSFLLGILLSLSFEPFNLPFMSVIIVGILFLVNDYIYQNLQNKKKIFFFTGLIFGFGFFISSINWISNSILQFNTDLYYLIPVPLLILPLVLSLFYALMQIFNYILWSQSTSRIFYFSANWVIFELLRSYIFSGFPWNLIAYSWSWSIYFMQSLSVFGVFGLSLITVFCAASFFSFRIKKGSIMFPLIAILVLLTTFIYGYDRVSNYEVIKSGTNLRIVHTDFNQNEKWKKESHKKIAEMGSQDLITIFPETAFGIVGIGPSNWFIGHIRNEAGLYYNSLSFNGHQYDKIKLVPFGEKIPLSNFLKIFFPKNSLLLNSMSSGNDDQSFEKKITPLICYEAVFPNFVRNKINNETELLVNITNDAWFGTFSGPKQHFVHVLYRSVELGLPLARSSNMGISALINPIGLVDRMASSDKISFIDVEIPKKIDTTIYRQYGELMVYFLIVLFFIIGYAIDQLFLGKKND